MYFLVALGLYLCIHSNKTFLFCFHDNFLLIQNFLFHINIVALLSSLDWYFQGNFCKGLPVDILYDNMKLYQKLFLCVCVPRKKIALEDLCLKTILTQIYSTFWKKIILDSVPLSFFALFIFCYFIFPEKAIIRFQIYLFLPSITLSISTSHICCLDHCLYILLLKSELLSKWFLV